MIYGIESILGGVDDVINCYITITTPSLKWLLPASSVTLVEVYVLIDGGCWYFVADLDFREDL